MTSEMAEAAIETAPSPAAPSRIPPNEEYYAVKSAKGLAGPAIFCSASDLRNVLDKGGTNDNNDAEWKSFDCIAEAEKYITASKRALNKKRLATHDISQQASRKRAATANNATMTQAAASTSESVAATAATTNISAAKLTPMEKSPKRPKLSLPPAAITAPTTQVALGSPTATPKKPVPAASSVKRPTKAQAFERKCALLAKYKQIHGDCTHIPTADGSKDGEFKGLHRFISDTKKKMKLFYQDATTSDLTEGNISTLEGLGFNNETIHRKQRSQTLPVTYLKTFDAMVDKLRQYQATHGHCNVPFGKLCPEGDTELSRWVVRTREQIKLFKKREPSALSIQHVKQVLDLGFELKPMHASRKLHLEERNASFDAMFQKLKAYKDEFGKLVVVPQEGNEDYTKLRSWTMYLRDEYKRMREGQETILIGDRIDRLRAIGFAFQAPHQRQTFSERAREWLDFKTKNGREPKQGDNRALCDWANRMRREAALLRQGIKSRYNVSPEQIDLLAGWGFNFNTNFNPDAPKPVFKKWEARFEDLIEYKKQNGDCLVPQLHPGLGDWVKKQRQQYKLFRKGKRNILNQEKIEKLQMIGFVWQVRAARPRKPKNERESDSEDSSNDNDDDNLFYNGARPLVAKWDRYR